MVESESGLKKTLVFLHAIIVMAWVCFSTVFYGTLVLILSFVKLRWAYFFIVVWSKHILLISGISIRTRGLEKLNKNETYIFVANHSSVFDITVLHAALPFHIVFIAKKELFKIPVFGQVIHAAGNISIDRSNAKNARMSINKAVKRLKRETHSLVLFPEGTRTVDGAIGAFRTASFTLALESGITIVPVYISGTYDILKRNSIHIAPGVVECIVADPIPFTAYEGLPKNALSEKIRTALTDIETKNHHSPLV